MTHALSGLLIGIALAGVGSHAVSGALGLRNRRDVA